MLLTRSKKQFMLSCVNNLSLGGPARHTYKAITLFDAFGFQKIIVETIGAGQDETDIGALSIPVL